MPAGFCAAVPGIVEIRANSTSASRLKLSSNAPLAVTAISAVYPSDSRTAVGPTTEASPVSIVCILFSILYCRARIGRSIAQKLRSNCCPTSNLCVCGRYDSGSITRRAHDRFRIDGIDCRRRLKSVASRSRQQQLEAVNARCIRLLADNFPRREVGCLSIVKTRLPSSVLLVRHSVPPGCRKNFERVGRGQALNLRKDPMKSVVGSKTAIPRRFFCAPRCGARTKQ